MLSYVIIMDEHISIYHIVNAFKNQFRAVEKTLKLTVHLITTGKERVNLTT